MLQVCHNLLKRLFVVLPSACALSLIGLRLHINKSY